MKTNDIKDYKKLKCPMRDKVLEKPISFKRT